MNNTFPPTPRINSAMLGNHIGGHVRLVGRVESQNSKFAVIVASDNGQVHVQMAEGAQYGTRYMEIIGVVNQDLMVSELTSTNFGDDFNLEIYNEQIIKAQKFPNIF
ncbi:replication factor A3 [Entomortierella parvispora]|uniref:Replication factor A3 n=1 Tax=Entomortierella parvispora TaxID=205924 RepID=A0A9P3LV21_9FUNG|nr:replication factor A3 [Entomortierella parvispora]